MVQKRFPADTSLDFITFLNDKKVDAELYSLFQEVSRPDEQKRTIVLKKNLPSQAEMCKKLGIKSPKTFREHRDYLIEQGYIVDEEDCYVLPNKEDIFFMIPLKTLQFLNDVLKDRVVKIYVYLGQRWKCKKNCKFTAKEIADHVGIKVAGNPRGYITIKNALLCLQKLGLIDYTSFYNGSVLETTLTNFSFKID